MLAKAVHCVQFWELCRKWSLGLPVTDKSLVWEQLASGLQTCDLPCEVDYALFFDIYMPLEPYFISIKKIILHYVSPILNP